ncbi:MULTISPECIES: hypothetical protein [unclassified Mesorhizobium]|uniref:DUF7946 domain-containing protein n=1 Tax=unclassified Mesorhizobium TaxID=325217 RepID=UPI000FCB9A67|nr:MULTISPECIES: hypothetical protein [unclassified Mesorhizobium]RUZ91489.1 hypothetical protein EN947_03640 [Mesorhizobium sp. M7A.F.Ca.US.003.02.2.1]RUY97029.1 hypothetical protein EN974_18295 [Mesorhizobium sp. M7A.F.Ca.CA.001.12.2.1]RUZ26103.1 hypothetical protein EN949_12770 [Mesorhizobium sp. M7A.F.Ca.US.007.01.2.1]RUZ50073.1 hypothetical protein EN948_02365 [Mesorhizobium sp. M7A.F.Ca.US.003.02.1.1]RUZ69570.1 hypothetical protein EN950_04005 [Mesorhizobium sp. M7A.F.Ca.US.007.01.1.1]
MSINVKFALSFSGNDADENQLDFYDAADALTGFQRSLALTTHLVLNGEIIVQAPYLRGARILIKSPEPGSWKVVTTVAMIAAGAHQLATAPRDTVLGNLVVSAYDYVISESLGFHVDFDSTLGQQYEELQRQRRPIAPKLTESQLDSLVEKTESSVKDMHRPIHGSRTASRADISSIYRRDVHEIATLDAETYDYVRLTTQVEHPIELVGRVSSYNINTFRGRIYVQEERRPIPFELAETCRDFLTVQMITHSLQSNARDRLAAEGEIRLTAFRFESSTGRLKRLLVTRVTLASGPFN